MLELLLDFIVDPILDYVLVSRQEGPEAGREAFHARVFYYIRIWCFPLCAALVLFGWRTRAYWILVPSALWLGWYLWLGIRYLMARLRS